MEDCTASDDVCDARSGLTVGMMKSESDIEAVALQYVALDPDSIVANPNAMSRSAKPVTSSRQDNNHNITIVVFNDRPTER